MRYAHVFFTKLFAIIFLLTPSVSALAGEHPLRFQHLSVEDGLSQSSALAMALDNDGFLWIGTYDGLNRYDGFEFKIYRTDPDKPGAISDVNIRALLVDSRGTLWVGTKNGGLNRYDRETDSFTAYTENPADPTALPGNQVRALFEDIRGDLWVGCYGGLARMDRKTGAFTVYKSVPGDPSTLSSDDIRCISEDAAGDLWIGADGGLNRMDPKTGACVRIPVESSIHPLVVQAIFPENGKIWLGTEADGLLRYDPVSGKTESLLADRAVWSIYKDSTGEFWVGTNEGLVRRIDREGGGFDFDIYRHNSLDTRSLSNDDVLTLLEDDSGILWVGTYADGLNKLNPRVRAFGLFVHKRGDRQNLSGNEISAIAEDAQGLLWVGTRNNGLNRINRKTNEYAYYVNDPDDPGSLSQNELTCLLADSKGRIWVGTADNGLNLLNPETGKFIHFRHDPDDPESLSQNKIWWIHEGSDGYLWIGTSKKGLNRFDPETGKCKRYQHDPDNPDSISHDRVRHIFERKDGYLWIGTNAGLNRFDRKTETFKHWENDPNDPKSLSNNRVTPILEDADGYLWVGTDDGLNRFDPKTETFFRLTDKDGLANDGIQGLLLDKEGALWMSTFKGISKYDPTTGMIRNYSTRDGLQGIEFWMNAYFGSPSGEMFFGGLSGMNAFYPDRVRWNRHAPPVAFTGLRVMNAPYQGEKNVNAMKSVVLPHKAIVFSLSFAALDFSDPERNRYAYKLEGFDEDWILSAGGHTATYTNLDPGKYVFRVKAANDDGVWNEKGTKLAVIITPPFWMAWWFRALAGASVLALILLVYRRRVGAIEKHRRLLAELVEVRTAELKSEVEERRMAQEAAIRAKLEAEKAASAKSEFLARMSHEIRTPINMILGMGEVLAETELSQRQREYVATFKSAGDLLLSVINDVLDFSKIESGRFELERAPFNPRLELAEISRFVAFRANRKGLAFDCDVDPSTPAMLIGDSVRLRQILLNLLGNAVKFTAEGEISLFIADAYKDEPGHVTPGPGDHCMLRFVVKDTGIGIPESAQSMIFKHFSQADASTTRKFGGSGLGLAICRRLAELMGGRISVHSVPGQGSEFTVTAGFDVADPSLVSDAPAPLQLGEFMSMGLDDIVSPERPIPEKGGHVGRILLAEDNRANRNLVRLYLEDLPLRIEEAENGAKALELIKEGRYDLALMDIEMPLMDGIEATRAIRDFERDKGRERTPVAALTAHVFSEQRQRCEEAGCDDFISKPMSKARLLETIRKYVPGLPETAFPRESPAPGGGPGSKEPDDGGAIVYVREKLINVLPIFLQSVDDGGRAMRQACEEADFETLHRHGHNLKGSAASFGFTHLAKMGGDIQSAAEGRDMDKVEGLLKEFFDYVERLEVRYR
jgi:signal transduction histidine kinase/ligand-binding sensor domain-containing protein/CheY-like chemotaxis protein